MVGQLEYSNGFWVVFVEINDNKKYYHIAPEYLPILESYHDGTIVEIEIISNNFAKII
jgi:hypothetical protein